MSDREALEEEITAIWQELFRLGPDEVDPDDSLFAVGGTSLQAVQLMTRIEGRFGVALPLPVVYAEGSISRLAELIEETLLESLADLTEEEARRLLDEAAGQGA
ncbi:acyl carrier protein [Kitasatospora brasiliensis]|uniref:acyl carrier protein n=1 Tax=Kitasatospora brasiliensis TaxID=3058040 RepID=UPI00292D4D4A|nr:acyl carrier protein [Kitasatospora sp. K002]